MATHAIQLRPGGARDAASVDTLMSAAFSARFGEAWTRGQVLGVMAMPGVRLTVAADDGRPVGFALVRTVLGEAELLLLAVDPAHRRRGTGGALIRAVIADARETGVTRLFLEVRAGNDAIRLYTRHGFARIGVRRNYYHGSAGSFDAHSYALTLD